MNLKIKIESNSLEEFFFKIIDHLHWKYVENNIVKSFSSEEKPPSWDNFNKFQYEEHMKFIRTN